MIARIHLCFSHATKVQGPSELSFLPGVNILVGPNGSGKSTVLRALHACDQCHTETDANSSVQYFDTETMNPHSASGPPGDMRNMVLRSRGVFSSHGQIMKAALVSVPLREGETLLVDEPEAGQDMDGVARVRQGFSMICAQGGQVIAASHHPLFLQSAHIIELVAGYAEEIRAEYCRALCESAGAEH